MLMEHEYEKQGHGADQQYLRVLGIGKREKGQQNDDATDGVQFLVKCHFFSGEKFEDMFFA